MSKFFIYKITNNINNKVYIGKANDPCVRFKKHISVAFSTVNKEKDRLPKLYSSIRKYGKENFSFEIIEEFDSEEESYEMEIKFIEKYNSFRVGLNSTVGGRGALSGSTLDESTQSAIMKDYLTDEYTTRQLAIKYISTQRIVQTITKFAPPLIKSKKRSNARSGEKNPSSKLSDEDRN